MRNARSTDAVIAKLRASCTVLLAPWLLWPVACTRPTPVALPSGAQAPALRAAASPGEGPGDQITVDLVVRTRQHKAVLDLQASELQVTDDGAPVQLTSLRRMEPASGSQQLVTFMVDRLDPSAARNARKAMDKVLSIIPDEGYSLAVLQVNGRLKLLQPYTHDFRLTDAALTQALPAATALPTADLTAAEQILLTSSRGNALSSNPFHHAADTALLAALNESQRLMMDRHGFRSLAALQALVESERLLPGRKFIFYVSSGLPSNSDAFERLHSIIGLAARADVTICVLDTSSPGASMSQNIQASQASSILGNGNTSGEVSAFGVPKGEAGAQVGLKLAEVHNVAGFEFGDIDITQRSLIALASGSGGVYLNVPGNLDPQLKRLHEDLTSWYQASWTPGITSYDGQFRPISVRSSRKDLAISGRLGYFAVPPAEGIEVLPFEVPLLKLLKRPSLPTDLPLRAQVLHLGDSPEGNAAELVLQVPVSALEVRRDSSTGVASVHAVMVAVIKDNKGTVLQRFGDDLPLHKTEDVLQSNAGRSLTLQRSFTAAPGTYLLETAAMDRLGSRTGAQRSTFTIEPPSQGHPALSDIALVQSVEPMEQASAAPEPMRYLDGRIVPNINPELPAGTHSLPIFFLLHPVSGSAAQPTLQVQVLHNDRVLADMPMELHKVSGTGGAIPYLATLSGGVFAPGRYLIKATLTQEGVPAVSSAAFTVAAVNTNAAVPPLEAVAQVPDAEAAELLTLTQTVDPMPPPSPAETEAMLDAARDRALAWSDSLRNFLCLEITNHFETTGQDAWVPKGSLVELMRYVDHQQTHTTLMLDGEQTNTEPDKLAFAHSTGEFGAMFHILFDPSAGTVFTWKQAAFLEGEPMQVFAFQVPRATSSFHLSDRDNHTRAVGFHGLLYLDPATRSVRRVTIVADDIPPALLIHASSVSVDYGWITMQDHDFLLPVHGTVLLEETRRRPVRNEFTFRNYHRFGSEVRIVAKDELKALSDKN